MTRVLAYSLLALLASCDTSPLSLLREIGDSPQGAAERAASKLAPRGCPPEVSELAESDRVRSDDPRLSKSLVVMLKSRRRLALYEGGELAEGACYRIGLAGGAPPGDKRRQGDRRTPEGWYRTSDKPWSQFYGAIAIHYPNRRDAEEAVAEGRIEAKTARAITRAIDGGKKPPQKTPLGGEILIHGGGGDRDWTLGCAALDNSDLDELRAALPEDMRTWALLLP